MKHVINTNNISFIEIVREQIAPSNITYEPYSSEISVFGVILTTQSDGGWYRFGKLLSKKELLEKYIERGDKLYFKPYIKINFIGSESIVTHYFDSEKELLSYINKFRGRFETI